MFILAVFVLPLSLAVDISLESSPLSGLALTSPSEFTVWRVGSKGFIAWDATDDNNGAPKAFKVELVTSTKPSAREPTILSGLPVVVAERLEVGPSAGSFFWSVPTNCYSLKTRRGCFQRGMSARYYLRFTSLEGPDAGNAAVYPAGADAKGFRIQKRMLIVEAPVPIALSSRYFMKSYIAGETLAASWRSINIKVPHSVSVSLHRNGASQRRIGSWVAKNALPGGSTNAWTIPQDIPTGIDAYRLVFATSLLEDSKDEALGYSETAVQAYSAPFSIFGAEIVLTSPSPTTRIFTSADQEITFEWIVRNDPEKGLKRVNFYFVPEGCDDPCDKEIAAGQATIWGVDGDAEDRTLTWTNIDDESKKPIISDGFYRVLARRFNDEDVDEVQVGRSARFEFLGIRYSFLIPFPAFAADISGMNFADRIPFRWSFPAGTSSQGHLTIMIRPESSTSPLGEYEIAEKVDILDGKFDWVIPDDFDRGSAGETFVASLLQWVPDDDTLASSSSEVLTASFTLDARAGDQPPTLLAVNGPVGAHDVLSADPDPELLLNWELLTPGAERSEALSFDVVDASGVLPADYDAVADDLASFTVGDGLPGNPAVDVWKPGSSSSLPSFATCAVRAYGKGGRLVGVSAPFFVDRIAAWIHGPSSGETLSPETNAQFDYTIIGSGAGSPPPSSLGVEIAGETVLPRSGFVLNELISRKFSIPCSIPGGEYAAVIDSLPVLWGPSMDADGVIGVDAAQLRVIFPRLGSVWRPGAKAQIVYTSTVPQCMPRTEKMTISITWGAAESLKLSEAESNPSGVKNITVPLSLPERDDYRVSVHPTSDPSKVFVSEAFTVYNAPAGEDLSLLLTDIFYQNPVDPSGPPTESPGLGATTAPTPEPSEPLSTALIVSLCVLGVLVVVGSVLSYRNRNRMCLNPRELPEDDDEDDDDDDSAAGIMDQVNPMTRPADGGDKPMFALTEANLRMHTEVMSSIEYLDNPLSRGGMTPRDFGEVPALHGRTGKAAKDRVSEVVMLDNPLRRALQNRSSSRGEENEVQQLQYLSNPLLKKQKGKNVQDEDPEVLTLGMGKKDDGSMNWKENPSYSKRNSSKEEDPEVLALGMGKSSEDTGMNWRENPSFAKRGGVSDKELKRSLSEIQNLLAGAADSSVGAPSTTGELEQDVKDIRAMLEEQ